MSDLHAASEHPSAPYEQEPTFFIDIAPQDLEKVLEDHKVWGTSGGKQGRRANLERVNLQGTDLHGVDLTEANLYQCNLSKANLQGASLAKANLQGALMGGTNLQKASLWEADLRNTRLSLANLQEANLTQANLEKANLREADLQRANMSRAVLEQAQLSLANLSGTVLRRANLQDATFHHAVLYEANLQESNLMGVKGLQIKQLRGANMSSAQLPEGIEDSDWLKHVEETSRKASRVFLIKLMCCLYTVLVVSSVQDVNLITSKALTTLPIIGTQVPITIFYWFAPVVLLGIFVYFHLYMQRLWEDLAAFPAVFPDGKSLDKKVYPWLVSGIVRAYVPHLRDAHLPFFGLQYTVTVLIVWCIVPLTLSTFFVSYLVRHDALGTAYLMGLVSLSIWMAFVFFKNATATMEGRKRKPFLWKEVRNDPRTRQASLLAVATLACWAFIFFGPFSLPRADLTSTNLFAADLRRSNLVGARLDGANLRSSRLNRVRMDNATMFSTQLENANLAGAILIGADMRAATLLGANLNRARLDGADLRGAKLQEADLSNVSLRDARLDRASLVGVTGLTWQQLCEASSILNTELDGELINQVTNHCVDLLVGQ